MWGGGHALDEMGKESPMTATTMRTPRPAFEGSTPRPAPATEGLNRLDRERAASVADEGGASGAAVEGKDAVETIPGADGRPIPRWSEEGRRRARRLRSALAFAPLAIRF